MAVVVPIAADFDPSGVKQATTEFQLFGQAMERTFQQAASNARKAFDNVESSATGASKKLKDTAANADRSRSVFANFAGNSAQAIPGLSNAFGPLNTAIGQFTEYASEGGIAIQKLVTAAAGIGAVTVALTIINKQLKDIQANAELRRDRVDAFFNAFQDGLTGVTAARKAIQEITEIRVPSGGIAGLLGGSETKDLDPILFKLKLRYDDLARAIASGPPAINRLIEGLRAQGAAADDVADVEQYLYNSLQAATEAMVRQRYELFLLGQDEAAVTAATAGLAGVFNSELVPQILAGIKHLANLQKQVQTLRDEVLASVNAEFAYADAIDNQTEAVARAQKARALANKTRKPEDIRAAERAERDVSKAVITTATSYGDLAAANNTAATGLDDATVAALGFYQQLEKGAAQFRPGGAVRGPLDEIIGRLEQGFPPEIRTRIVFDFATGQVSRTGTIGDPTGGRGGLVGVTTPVVTSNASAGTNVTVNVSGFVGSETQLTDTIRRGLNNDSNRRGADFVLP